MPKEIQLTFNIPKSTQVDTYEHAEVYDGYEYERSIRRARQEKECNQFTFVVESALNNEQISFYIPKGKDETDLPFIVNLSGLRMFHPQLISEALDGAWEDYLKDLNRLEELGYKIRGNTTYYRPISAEAAQEIDKILGY